MIGHFAAYRLGYAETILVRDQTPEAVGIYGSSLRDALRQCPEVARASLDALRAYPAIVALLADDIRAEVAK